MGTFEPHFGHFGAAHQNEKFDFDALLLGPVAGIIVYVLFRDLLVCGSDIS